MPNFSAFIPDTHHGASPGFVDMSIHARRSELFSGLMQFRLPTQENLVLAFVEGVEHNLYRCSPNANEIIPRADWPKTLFSAEVSVGALPLSLEAMRVVQVAHEAPVVQVEQLDVNSRELAEQAARWALDARPCIIHVQSTQGDYFCLCADRSERVFEEVIFSAGKAQFSMSDPSFTQALPAGTHRVTRYVSVRDHDVWRGYELRLAFVPLMRMLMKRFGELAGRGLTERLGEQLTAWARGGGWNMIFSSNGVVHRQYFDSLQEAVNACADLLGRFQLESSSAIGPRLVEIISREVLAKLDASRRELLLRYIFSQPGLGGVVRT